MENAGGLGYYNLFNGKPRCFYVMKNFISAKHAHKETEIAYPVNGGVDVVIRDSTFHVQMQEILVIPGNAMHYYVKTDEHVDVVNVKFLDEWLVPTFYTGDNLARMKKFLQNINHFSYNPVLSGVMNNMIHIDGNPYPEYYLWGCLIELMAYGLSNLHWLKSSVTADVGSTRYMEELLLYVQEHYLQDLSLSSLAEHVGLTESYCSKYFKQSIGTSFLEYITTRRVSHAQRLLKYTNYSITEIMADSGFSSIQTFNRVFKKYTGETPTEFRKN